ncbi:MAG: VWA domain-containing protein [Anaerolineae bacterium]|nr:VWA domain-containing protein [Anaerolineae bacterium]MDW8173146.1 VWA domain-containing protein [Anaerolineae bacterium]
MKRLTLWMVILPLVLTACGGSSEQSNAPVGNTGGVQPRPGYEIFDVNGAVPRPQNAVEIYVGYSPEAHTYMPELIRRFNQLSAEGKNPLTGAALGSNERPIYVWGTQPKAGGSSGTMAQGVFNAVVAPANENVYKPTIFIPSTVKWLAWVNFQTRREIFKIDDAKPIAPSPVILGIWEERLKQLERMTGKSRDEIGWADILRVLENGWNEGRRAVFYGHADPRHSSTGLSATVSEFYACARREGFASRVLTVDAVDDQETQECMRDLQGLVRHYARRTEDFLNYFGQGPDYLDMLALEEVDLICINMGAVQGDEQCLKPQGGNLVALYPSEGILWHDRAAAIVQYDAAQGGWTTQEQREAARVFIDFLLTVPSQEYIMTFGFRPANPAVPLAFPIVEANGIQTDIRAPQLDLPSIETINAIQQSWSLVKKQADVMILIDVSGSMNEEDKIGQARAAARAFVENLETNNRVGLMVFSSTLRELVPLDLLESNKQELLRNIDNLVADGGTELFLSVVETMNIMNRLSDESRRARAVVLLSDGEDTGSRGTTLNDAVRAVSASRNSLNPVILVPLAYGKDASIVQLNALADASKTRVLSGTPENIGNLLRLLSSYF